MMDNTTAQDKGRKFREIIMKDQGISYTTGKPSQCDLSRSITLGTVAFIYYLK
jgi:hypothetical protein